MNLEEHVVSRFSLSHLVEPLSVCLSLVITLIHFLASVETNRNYRFQWFQFCLFWLLRSRFVPNGNGNVFEKPLPRNCRLSWLHHSSFQTPCHIIFGTTYSIQSYVRDEFHWLRNTGTIDTRLKCLFYESECHDVRSVDAGGWGASMLLRHTNIFNIHVCSILAATNLPPPHPTSVYRCGASRH